MTTTMNPTPHYLRAVRLVLGTAAVTSVAACGKLPTAPTASPDAAVRPADGASRASGYMLSSGRHDH